MSEAVTGLSSQILPLLFCPEVTGTEKPQCVSLLTETAECSRTQGRLGTASAGDVQGRRRCLSPQPLQFFPVLTWPLLLQYMVLLMRTNGHFRAESFFNFSFFKFLIWKEKNAHKGSKRCAVCLTFQCNSIGFSYFSNCCAEDHICIGSSKSLAISWTKKSAETFKTSTCDHCLANYPSIQL